MTPHLQEAVDAWLTPKLRQRIERAGLLPRDVTEEEADAYEAFVQDRGPRITREDWPFVCALSDRFRQHKAEGRLSEEASVQIARAEKFLDLTEKDFLHWPWPAMDAVVGGMAPGSVHGIVCPSKGGKTTLMRSAARQWIEAGRRVFYGGFEMRAETLRTMYAADDSGIDPGDVLTGAWRGWAHFEEKRAQMIRAYRHQEDATSCYRNLRFSSFDYVDEAAVRSMMQEAHDWGADVVILDHVDHIEVGAGKQYEMSVKALRLLETLTKKYDLKTIFTSQTNYEGRTHDKFRDHRPVQDTSVKMGGTKKEIVWTMLGFYRPLKPGFTKEERQQVEYGDKTAHDFLWPGVNAFNVMGHRAYGARIGQRGYLGWDRGRIVDPDPSLRAEIEARLHGIKTAREL